MRMSEESSRILVATWLKNLEEEVGRVIEAVPSGNVRNILTELNIVVLMAQEEVKKEDPTPLFERLSTIKPKGDQHERE